MSNFKRALFLILIAALTAACGAPGVSALSIAARPGSAGTPLVITAPQNATPTATPFQPLPPTQVFYPTDIPPSALPPTATFTNSPTATPAATATPTAMPTATPTATPFLPSPTDLPLPQEAENIPAAKGIINFLLLGSDQRVGESGFRTDTIILATLNTKDGTLSLTSFPRDLFVTIPYWGQDRINTAWQHGGFDSLAATFEYNFGVTPDHYILINFHSFTKVIDSLGGIDVNVGKPLVAKRQGRGMVEVPEGVYHMNGKTALWYVRSRKSTNDFDRGRRQQEVIQAIAEKLASLDALRRAPELYDSYKGFVTTDLSFRDILSLLPTAAKFANDPATRIQSHYIGPEAVWDWISPGGGMVLLPNQPAIMEVLRKALKGN